MKLARKIALALAAVVIAAFALQAWLGLRREVLQYEVDMRRDHFLLGKVLSAALLNEWRADGLDDALALIPSVQEFGVRVRWVWQGGARAAARPPRVSPEKLARLSEGSPVVVLDRQEGGEGVLYSYFPLRQDGDSLAALEISESLSDERAFARAAASSAAASSLAFALLGIALAAALGMRFVGRPVSRLVEKARRVGRGDLSGPLEGLPRDELGALAEEMNAMCERLADARDRLAAETASRISAQEQLRHADRLSTVGKLASGIAHELGTPLNVISGRSRMIQSGEVEGTEARSCARIIAGQAEAMARIIRQLLDFARARKPEKSPEDLRLIAQQTLVMLLPLAEKRQVAIRLEAGEAPALAEVDSNQILQALTNLVINGLHATEPGGSLTIGIAGERAMPPAGSSAERDCLRLFVKDTGAGIAREHLPHIFEPFFTTKGVGEGSGLGLSVAWGIAQEHGGWIAVETELGKGSCFSIYLPRQPDAARPLDRPASGTAPAAERSTA
jgi:two-component system NtrC family sensor kinase